MRSTQVTASSKKAWDLASDVVVFCFGQEKKKISGTDPVISKFLDKVQALGDFSGKADQQVLLYPSELDTNLKIKAKRILIMGMGPMDAKKEPETVFDIIRKTAGEVAKACKKINAKTVGLVLPAIRHLPVDQVGQCLMEGLLLGDYHFLKYKETTAKKEDYQGIKTVRVICQATDKKKVDEGIQKGVNAACAVCDARDMANEPANGWTADEFAEYARSLAEEHDLTYTCLEKEDMKTLGMGGILGVNQGSAIPPKMVILEYSPADPADTVLLVGKGITFDTGGISLKPGAGMEEMKYDMCGGAAVLSAMQAVGKEKPEVKVVGIVPATDNMPSGSAIRPGDIIRHFNGVTSEIVNTDAEGRMILGDALSYGIKMYEPDCVIDIATLTGAVIIGLGHHYTGLVSNHDRLSNLLENAGKEAGEPIWRLPLTEDYKEQIESKVADIKNVGGKPAGSITAGAYLSNFVGDTPWAHLDIAGTAWGFTKKSYVPEGPSGIGTRTFIYLIRNWKQGALKK